MALRHIIFDCDGVLWDGTNEGYFRCYHSAAVKAGIDLDFSVAKARILKNWGQSAQLEIKGMLLEHPDRVPEVLSIYREFIRSDLFLSTAALVPGAETALQTLSRSCRLSAISGMNADNLRKMFARFRLRPLFRHVVSTAESDDPQKQKCTGYHLRQLLESEGVAPDEAIVIGDALPDVQMARRCKVPIVAVLTGHLTEPEARSLSVDAILPSVRALPDWIAASGRFNPTAPARTPKRSAV